MRRGWSDEDDLPPLWFEILVYVVLAVAVLLVAETIAIVLIWAGV